MSKIEKLIDDIVLIGKNGTGKEWTELSKLINSKVDEAKSFVGCFKNKIKLFKNEDQYTLVDILDYVMVEGKMPLHTQIATKDFISVLIGLMKQKENPELQVKILYLVKKWGLRFETQKDILPNFFETYSALLKSGVKFPEKMNSNFNDYFKDQSVNEFQNFSNFQPSRNDNIYADPFPTSSTVLELNPNDYPKKYNKFVGELSILMENIILANEIIDNSKVGDPIDESLSSIIHNVKNLERNLALAIQNSIDHEKLMEICLGFNDDINNTYSRYEELRHKKKPSPFFSVFIKQSPVKESEVKGFANLNLGGNAKVEEKKNEDLFDFISSADTSKNVNQNQPIVQPQKQPQINDIINNIFEQEYGNKNQAQINQPNQFQPQNSNIGMYPSIGPGYNANPLQYPNVSQQSFQPTGQSQIKPGVNNNNPLDDLFGFGDQKSQNNNQGFR